MPNTKSAAKALRQSKRRHARNVSIKSATKTYLRRAEEAIGGGDAESPEAVRKAISALDRAAEKDVIHKNNAARRKSRLMKKLNTMLATSAVETAAAAAKSEAPPANEAPAKRTSTRKTAR